MYFNRKNAEQKNWRMIKKGKHFLFGCSLVFAVGAALVAPSVKADTAEAKPGTSSTAEGTKPISAEENPTYAAPAVEVAPVVATEENAEKAVETTQNSKEEPVVATEKAKEADSIQAPEVTVVYNPAALTDEEKAKVVAAVKAANPTATDVQVQADGSVVVAFADGSRANLTAAQTIKDGSLVAKPRTNRALRATAPRASEGAENLEYTNKKRGEVVVDDYIKISYEVDNAKNVIHWTTVVNGGRVGNAASGYTYFTVPKDSVGTPTNWKIVQTDKNGKVMSTRTDWKNNDGSYVMGAKGKTNVYTGDEMTKKLAEFYKNIGNPALKGKEAEAAAQAAARSQALYTLTADVAGGWLGKNPSWTITYDTPILDKSKPLDYIAGLQGTGGAIGAKTEIMTGFMDNFIDNASSKFQAVAVKDKYTAKVGESFDATPANYVTNKAGTPEFPNNYRGATTFAWKDGQAPTATEAGTYTKTVVVTYPAHYKQAPQEVTITFEVEGEKPSKPVVDTDLTGKAGTKDPVVVTADPGTKVELFDKDGNKIGEATAGTDGKATITPTVDIPAGNVTATATKDGQTSDASDPMVATATPAKPSKPVVDTDLTGKAGTKDPVVVTADPGTKVELFDKDGNKIGEATAGTDGKATITPTVDIPAGNVTATATKDGQTSDASDPMVATATPAKPSKPVVDTDLTGKAGTKDPVVVTADPGTKVELFDKDGNKIGEATAGTDGKATITPTVDIPAGNVTATATKDGQTSDASDPMVATATPAKPSKPVVDTDLTGKAGTKDPVVVTADPGTKVELFDKDGNKIGEATAGTDGKATITPTVDIPAGNVTATATKDGQTSDASDPMVATATPAKPSKPVVDTDLTGKAGTKDPVVVTADPGTKVELFDKDGNKIGEATAGTDGKATITPTVDIPAGNVTATATKDGQTSDASDPMVATATPAKPSKPVVDTDLTGKAGTKDPVVVTADPGTKVELFDKDGNKIGEATAGTDGKATITPTVDIPAGNVTATATKDGQTSDASDPMVATATPAKPSKPVVDTDLTGKAGTKDPVVVTADPGTKVELFDKDGNKIGEATAGTDGKATITPTVDIPAGNVTATATKDGQTSDASDPMVATATPAKPSKPVVDTDLTGKAGTKDPVVVTADPGTKVELFDKDGNKIGEATAGTDGKATITPTVDIPAGNVTATATKDGQTSDASDPMVATATPAKPSKPVVDTDLTGKAGTKDPVVVTADPGTKVELFDKDGNKIGEATAGTDGKATITPTVDIPAGNVTATATKDGQTSDASDPMVATATPAKPSKPVVDTDLTGKAGTKDPVVVTADPGTKVELFDKDGNKIGEATAGTDGKATITPTVDIPAGNVTATATKDGQTSDASDPMVATATPAKPSKPVVDTDLTGKAGTKDPVVVTADPGTKVELFDKDGNKIGEATAGTDGKATITPTVDIPAGNVTATATKDGQTSDASDPMVATATPAKPSKPVVDTDLTGKAGTKDPVVVTADPGTKVELFDKDGNKIGEATAGTDGKATITPTVDIPAGNVTATATKDGQTSDASDPMVATATPAKPSKPVVDTDLTGKAGTKDPVVVTADPGTKVELFDKDGNKIGEATAGTDGKATITPTVDIPAGNVTATATKDGQTSDASDPMVATATPAKPSKPVVDTDLTGKAGTKDPVVVTADPGTKVELFDKDGNKIGEATAGTDGKATITPTVDIPAGNVTATATKDGQTSDASDPMVATATPAKPSKPVVDTDLTGKAGTKDPVVVTADPGTKVELFDKDGNKIGEATAGTDGKATITPTVDIPAGNVTATATKDGQTSDASDPMVATATPAKPSKPVVDTDLTGKAGTKDPVVVTADPGTKVELFDKDGNKIGEATAGTDGKATITPTVDIPAGNVTATATKDGQTSDASDPMVATATPAKPSKPVVDTDLTGKAGTKDPVVVTADPGTKVELFDKDGNKIGEATAGTDGKATITPTVDIPAGNVTATATKDGQTSDASDPMVATATPAKPSKPVVDTDLTGKAGTKDPVVVTADPGTKVELFDKDGNKIGEATAGTDGKATITPTVDIPAGNVTATATKDGQTSDASDPMVATKDPAITPVVNPSALTDAEKAKVADEVKKANPTASKVEVGNDGTATVTFPDGSVAVLTPAKTVKEADSNGVKDPKAKTPVKDPANLTDAEKAKVADEVKKANPTASKVEVGNDGTATVTFPDGSTATVTPDKTVKEADSNGVKDPKAKTPVKDPANLTDAEKAKVADEVKKANPTATNVEVGKDGTTTVTFPDGSTATVTPDKTVKEADSNGVKDPEAKTPVKDPANLTDAEKAKVADEVKKANPTAKDIKVNNDGSVVVTFADGSVAVIASEKAVKEATKESSANPSAKKAGAKELPNTGTEQSNASLALALLAAATGGLLIAKKRKEEE